MTWDAYNRRKEVLHEVLAIADRRRGEFTVTELLAEVDGAHTFVNEADLLLDAQMVWAHALNGQMDRTAFLDDGTLETAVVTAWHAAAVEHPTLRRMLDRAVDLPEMADAFAKEHEFLARSIGVAANHPDIDGHGRRVKDDAVASVSYPSEIPDTPAGIFDRIREALAA